MGRDNTSSWEASDFPVFSYIITSTHVERKSEKVVRLSQE